MMLPNMFIPSYHRPTHLKTVNYFVKLGYPVELIHVFIDDEADDMDKYEEEAKRVGFNLHVFDMEESRERYDYVHRSSKARRSAGQARNMFYDYARMQGIDFYVVIDDDTTNYQVRPFGVYKRTAQLHDFEHMFCDVEIMMRKYHIGLFGLSQTGEMMSPDPQCKLIRHKIMNTTFILLPYVYRGERGVQDDDTSQFATAINEGYFIASFYTGLVLLQTQSAKQGGGLTDLYNECKLLNKALITPIQFPSAIHAERQKMNGNRIHHRINYRYIQPKILRVYGVKGNIGWDTYPEDVPFTNEPRRRKL